MTSIKEKETANVM